MVNQAYPSLNGIEPSWADINGSAGEIGSGEAIEAVIPLGVERFAHPPQVNDEHG